MPLTSQFLLNGTAIQYGFKGNFSLGALDGDERDPVPQVDQTVTLHDSLRETLADGLFHRRQVGWYAQLRSTTRKTTVITTRREAVDLSGSHLFLSITGRCIFPGADPDSYCSYTPGTDATGENIDPDTLLPGQFTFDSEFGTTIDKATHEALKAPGWQRGVAGSDEQVGLEIDLPNTGYTYADARKDMNSAERVEKTRTGVVPSLSYVEQNLYSNDRVASLDRTVRGFVLLDADDWNGRTVAMQAMGLLLPALNGKLSGGAGDANLGISNNLFYAANNNRVPDGGFTVFQTSLSRVHHTAKPPTRASETPVAWSNGVWLGFSPVRDITVSTDVRYRTTGPREIVTSSFEQGGMDGADLVDGRITVIDQLTQELAQIDLTNISDLFVQSGGDTTTQEAMRIVTQSEVSRYHYVPELSFTGNRTSGTSVFRYYAGALLGDDANAYVGADYSLNTASGWAAYLGGEYYSNPDRDHYSNIRARLNRKMDLSGERTLNLGVSASVELDRPDTDGTTHEVGEGDNLVDFIAGYQHGPTSLTFRERLANLGSDATASTTLAVGRQIDPRTSLSIELTPISNEDSYIAARVGLSHRISDAPDAPTLRLDWARINYEYASASGGGSLDATEQTLLASFQMRF